MRTQDYVREFAVRQGWSWSEADGEVTITKPGYEAVVRFAHGGAIRSARTSAGEITASAKRDQLIAWLRSPSRSVAVRDTITITSFGYRHGGPPADSVAVDVREGLLDPHIDPALRELTGHDEAVQERVHATRGVDQVVRAVATLAANLVGVGVGVAVSVGCAGGRHRSVVIAEAVAALLRTCGQAVVVAHRDVHLPVVQRDVAGPVAERESTALPDRRPLTVADRERHLVEMTEREADARWLVAEAQWHRQLAEGALDVALLTSRDREVADLTAARDRAVAEAVRLAELAHARHLVSRRIYDDLVVALQRAEIEHGEAVRAIAALEACRRERDEMAESWLTTKDVAEYALLHEKTALKLLMSGEIVGSQPTGENGRWYARRSDVDRWIKGEVPR
ncbi:RapZ C-terminal domain-containing protein [Actinophytocola sediminis]